MPRQKYKSKSDLRKKDKEEQIQIGQEKNMFKLSSDQEELLKQLVDALISNQIQTIEMLIQDQNQKFYEKLIHNIPIYLNTKQQQSKDFLSGKNHQQIIEKMKEIWHDFQTKKIKKLQQEEHEDNIRKINKQYHQNCNQQQENSSKLLEPFEQKNVLGSLMQSKFGFILYGNVRCLMIAYGDLHPVDQSIKIMHSQVQLFFKTIFEPLMVIKKKCKSKDLLNSAQIDQKKITISSKNDLRQYLSKICYKEYNDYEQISKVYKKVKNKTKISQPVISTMPQESSQNDSLSFSDCSEELDEQQGGRYEKIQQKHLQTKDRHEIQYFIRLIDQMDEQQYRRYSLCRIVNFLYPRNNQQSRKKFMKFIDPQQKIGEQILDFRNLELCSFIGCKIVKKIIFEIIKSLSFLHQDQSQNDRQQKQRKIVLKIMPKSLDASQITSVGNSIIDSFTEIVQNVNKVEISLQLQAQKTFIKQINECKKIAESIPKELKKKYAGRIQQLWRDNKDYRKLWIERLKGEQQIQNYLRKAINKIDLQTDEIGKAKKNCCAQIIEELDMDGGSSFFNNLYAKFIKKHIQIYLLSFWESIEKDQPQAAMKIQEVKINIFRQYLTGDTKLNKKEQSSYREKIQIKEEVSENNESKHIKKKQNKRMKLQSLKN